MISHNMEKNKQILEFANIINDKSEYKIIKRLFLNYIEYINMSWDDYIKIKTKKEIIEEFNNFNLYYYLPF